MDRKSAGRSRDTATCPHVSKTKSNFQPVGTSRQRAFSRLDTPSMINGEFYWRAALCAVVVLLGVGWLAWRDSAGKE